MKPCRNHGNLEKLWGARGDSCKAPWCCNGASFKSHFLYSIWLYLFSMLKALWYSHGSHIFTDVTGSIVVRLEINGFFLFTTRWIHDLTPSKGIEERWGEFARPGDTVWYRCISTSWQWLSGATFATHFLDSIAQLPQKPPSEDNVYEFHLTQPALGDHVLAPACPWFQSLHLSQCSKGLAWNASFTDFVRFAYNKKVSLCKIDPDNSSWSKHERIVKALGDKCETINVISCVQVFLMQKSRRLFSGSLMWPWASQDGTSMAVRKPAIEGCEATLLWDSQISQLSLFYFASPENCQPHLNLHTYGVLYWNANSPGWSAKSTSKKQQPWAVVYHAKYWQPTTVEILQHFYQARSTERLSPCHLDLLLVKAWEVAGVTAVVDIGKAGRSMARSKEEPWPFLESKIPSKSVAFNEIQDPARKNHFDWWIHLR